MKTETLTITRLTVSQPIRTSLSEARIRFALTVERITDCSSCLTNPTVRYRLSFKTSHPTEALEVFGDGDELFGTDRFQLPGQLFDLLTVGDEAQAIRDALGDLQQCAQQGYGWNAETRRILVALWAGIDTTPVTA